MSLRPCVMSVPERLRYQSTMLTDVADVLVYAGLLRRKGIELASLCPGGNGEEKCQASRSPARDLFLNLFLRSQSPPTPSHSRHPTCGHQCVSLCERQSLFAPAADPDSPLESRRSVNAVSMPPTPPGSSSALGASYGAPTHPLAQQILILEVRSCRKPI